MAVAVSLAEDMVELEKPLVKVRGEPFLALPEDLYIPPDALEIILETFEGPLDLLLYLIKRQNLDLLDIPIAHITQQYIEYIELMTVMRFELAAEYLVMAATLAEMKSRLLLPRMSQDEEVDIDPRMDLIRRLQEYERYKNASEALDELPRLERDFYHSTAWLPSLKQERPLPEVDLNELLLALKSVMQRVALNERHQIQKESLSLRERMTDILSKISEENYTEFSQLFSYTEGRQGVVVTFIAILELLRQSMIELVQAAPYQPIHVRAVSATYANPT